MNTTHPTEPLRVVIANAVAPNPDSAQFVAALPGLWALAKRSHITVTPHAPQLLSAVHERALAQSLGLDVADGCVPLAALQSPEPIIEQAHLRFCNWDIAVHGTTLTPPDLLQISEQQSEWIRRQWGDLALNDGFFDLQATPGDPHTWVVRCAGLGAVPLASWSRVSSPGANVNDWLGALASPQIKALRRLQNEFQMLMYTAPLNDERSAQGLLPINSFWLSGAGSVAELPKLKPARLDERLLKARSEPEWQAAWRSLDERLPQHFTLCGPAGYASFTPLPNTFMNTLKTKLSGNPLPAVLQQLTASQQ